MESGMRVGLQERGASRNRLLVACKAIVPELIILTTFVSCSRRAAEMPEPRYQFVEPALPFLSLLTDGENHQRPQPRFDEQTSHRAEQARTSAPPPKTVRVHTADTTRTPASRPVSGKTSPRPLLD